MTDIDRRTKAQILDELNEAKRMLTATTERNRELESATPARVPVADAVAGCIRALDRIASTNRSSLGYDPYRKGTDVDHVIDLLIAKYGVPPKQVFYPAKCDREHVGPDEF